MLKDEIALGPGKAELLEAIEATGSIREAAERLGMSYMRAWKLVKTINACFREPLVISERGGRHKGGAKLSRAGADVVKSYRSIEKISLKASAQCWTKLRRLLRG